MQHLYFLRHGQTHDNLDDTFSGYDIPLDETGCQQAIAAGNEIARSGLQLDAIISSPMPRALETARLAASQIGFPPERIETLSQLAERDSGELKGMTQDSFFASGHSYRDIDDVKGAEPIARLQERAQAALDYLKERPEKTILIVSHAGFGRAFRRVLHGLPYTDEFRDAHPHGTFPNATLIQLI